MFLGAVRAQSANKSGRTPGKYPWQSTVPLASGAVRLTFPLCSLWWVLASNPVSISVYDFSADPTSSIKTFPPLALGTRKKLMRVPSAPERVAG